MDEKTSKRVAKIAGRILRIFENNKIAKKTLVRTETGFLLGTVADIEALAASALTQTGGKK